LQGDLDTTKTISNTFQVEWPPKSGKVVAFPEVDRSEFFPVNVAKLKINRAQVKLLENLERVLSPK
jgi:predicted NUDIX family NTP pyrophosphohydrolase